MGSKWGRPSRPSRCRGRRRGDRFPLTLSQQWLVFLQPSRSTELSKKLASLLTASGTERVVSKSMSRSASFSALNWATKGGRGQTQRWFEWGSLDIDAVPAWALARSRGLPVHFVGHSFGGFGVGLAAHAASLSRILTVGGQHAHWRDFSFRYKVDHAVRCLVVVPLVAVYGYFPAKRLGAMEDLPRAVALDWARSRKDFTAAATGSDREALRANQLAVTAPIIAVAPNDDSYATLAAMERAVAYTPNSAARIIHLRPEDYGEATLGHFALFHSRYRHTFWEQTLGWLGEGSWK